MSHHFVLQPHMTTELTGHWKPKISQTSKTISSCQANFRVSPALVAMAQFCWLRCPSTSLLFQVDLRSSHSDHWLQFLLLSSRMALCEHLSADLLVYTYTAVTGCVWLLSTPVLQWQAVCDCCLHLYCNDWLCVSVVYTCTTMTGYVYLLFTPVPQWLVVCDCCLHLYGNDWLCVTVVYTCTTMTGCVWLLFTPVPQWLAVCDCCLNLYRIDWLCMTVVPVDVRQPRRWSGWGQR